MTAETAVRATWAVVPVKDLDHAKTRLAGVLDDDQRRELASAMLADTLDRLLATASLAGVVVVSGADEVLELARSRGATALEEPAVPPDAGRHTALNAGLEAARAAVLEGGAVRVLTVPIDLPLLPALDLDALLSSLAGVEGIALQPDEHDDGTNFLLQSPADAIPFRYGSGSADRHAEEAERRGFEVRRLHEPTLSWDVDRPDDPRRWAEARRRDPEIDGLVRDARERGTALRFLESTDWGRPLAGSS